MAKGDEKACRKLMDLIDDVNPYATYLSESTFSSVDNWIDTGSLALNAIISGSLYKGVPEGRVIQFAGPSMTGKTFFVQKIIANAQKMGKFVVVFDSENAIDKEGALGFGIDPTKVKYIPTTTIENTRNAIRKFLKGVAEAGEIGKFVIVIDSIAQLESELGESRMEEDKSSADMGTFAKAIKSLLKTCVNWGKLTKTTVVITNEVYDNPTVMYPPLDKNMPGGKGAAYKPSVTIQLARKPVKADEGRTIDDTMTAGQKSYSGVELGCLSVKNRFIKQYLEVDLYLSFATGLDKYYGLLKLLRGFGVVVLDGKTYKDWEGNSLGFYKKWRKDKALWEDKLLPELEKLIGVAWKYSNEEDAPDDEEEEEDDLEEADDDDLPVVKEEETPLQKLKALKGKVSKTIDDKEAEEALADLESED
jgi:RecA/RadA recombinase